MCCGISALGTPPAPPAPLPTLLPGAGLTLSLNPAQIFGTWYCAAHDASEKRVKVAPHLKECDSCHITVQTTYEDFELCGPCAEREQRCMICGSDEPSLAPCGSPSAPPAHPPTWPTNCKVMPPLGSLRLAAAAPAQQSPAAAPPPREPQQPTPLQATVHAMPVLPHRQSYPRAMAVSGT